MMADTRKRGAGSRSRSRGERVHWIGRATQFLFGNSVRLGVFIAFAVLVALTGGGSRSDILSLVILRPCAVLFAAYAFICMSGEEFRRVRPVLLLVLAFMAYVLLQLVPLPPSIWTELPGREVLVDFSNTIGQELSYRPFSLDPNRTWNGFFAMFVPLAAMALVAIQSRENNRIILPCLLAIGALSVAIAILQVVGASKLYFYQLSNTGYPIGLFANRNHQSVFLGWIMLAACFYVATSGPRDRAGHGGLWMAIGVVLLLLPIQVLTGSRAGLLLSAPILAVCGWMVLQSAAVKGMLDRVKINRKLLIAGGIAIAILPLVFIALSLLESARQTAFSRAFESDFEELRLQLLPILGDMAMRYFPFGSGLGSFERVFMMHEPAEMLSRRYVNQAHNDFIQLVIETGIVGAGLVVAGFIWFAGACLRIWRSGMRGARIQTIFYVFGIGMWMAASIVDYPLRTPLAAMLVAILTAQLCRISNDLKSGLSPAEKRDQQQRPPQDDTKNLSSGTVR